MEILSEKREKGVVEQRFGLKVGTEVIPGIRWLPDGGDTGPRATILIGHGGTQHKRVPNVLGLARRFVRHLGYGAIALDAPGHGERVTDPDAAERRRVSLQARLAAGPGQAPQTLRRRRLPNGPAVRPRAWAEWRALLDDLDRPGATGARTATGASPWARLSAFRSWPSSRVSAPPSSVWPGWGAARAPVSSSGAARSLRIPILFMFQWDDELMSRESGLALFDAIGSADKTMHINPGGHVQIPLFESDASEAFFLRHLGASR